MIPNFSLNLSHEGIVLLHRSPNGNWVEVGAIALDDPDLRENLSFLRSTAVGLDGKGFGTKLIIPNSQILYRAVHAPGPSAPEREAQIAAALDGDLPYPLEELAIDWRADGQEVTVAIVARETLEEAESFAVEHRFNPICFVARENEAPQSWEPYFGRTDYSYAILDEDVDLKAALMGTPPPSDEPALFDDLETPVAEEPPLADESEAPQRPAPEVTNFFVDDLLETGEEGNLFSGGKNKPDPAEAKADETVDQAVTPVPTQQAGASETEEPDVTQAPAFASRRTMMTVSGGPKDKRPLDRVTPRLALAEAQPAAPTPGLTLSDEDRLRSDVLRDDEKSPSRVAQLAATLREATRNTGPAIAGLGRSGMDRIAPAFASASRRIKALPRVRLPGLPKLPGGPSLGQLPGLGKKTARSDTSDDLPTVVPLDGETSPALAGAAESATVETEMPEAHGDTPATRPDRKKLIAAGILALALLGGGLLWLLPGGETVELTRDPALRDGTENAILTLAERGVRIDNRARHRPSDFEATIAALYPAEERVIGQRPARRSLLEGAEDPDLGKPDTAEEVLDLSEEELADIRRAGAPLPTAEEIAETGESGTDKLFSDEEIAVLYAETGVLQEVRTPPLPRLDQDRDDIFVAQPDVELGAQDATILPDFAAGVGDDQPRQLLSPLAPDIDFDVDERGLVIATREGALNPDGILIRAGRPDVRPPQKPAREELIPPNPLAALKPRARPETLKTGEEAIFVQGRLTIAQLRDKRARHRPESEQFAQETETSDETPTELAILTSFQPAKRPSDFAEKVEKTRTQLASVAPATEAIERSVDRGPALPTRASVAKRATIKNAINLSKINLIGVYGSPSKRSALLRLPSGRYVKVKIGDRIDGGRVAAISTNTLSYVKSGRNRVLKVPN